MKIKIRKICLIISFVSIMITACDSKIKSKSENNLSNALTKENVATTDSNLENEDNQINSDVTLNSESQPTDSQINENERIAPVINKEISIYTLNDSSLEVEAAIALVPEDTQVTPELIVELVVDSLADRSILVGIDAVTKEDDAVIVSFLSDQPPLVNVGGSVEATILDSIAQSLVDNIKDYPKVIFRVEGGPYISGHYEYGVNYVYLDGNKTK